MRKSLLTLSLTAVAMLLLTSPAFAGSAKPPGQIVCKVTKKSTCPATTTTSTSSTSTSSTSTSTSSTSTTSTTSTTTTSTTSTTTTTTTTIPTVDIAISGAFGVGATFTVSYDDYTSTAASSWTGSLPVGKFFTIEGTFTAFATPPSGVSCSEGVGYSTCEVTGPGPATINVGDYSPEITNLESVLINSGDEEFPSYEPGIRITWSPDTSGLDANGYSYRAILNGGQDQETGGTDYQTSGLSHTFRLFGYGTYSVEVRGYKYDSSTGTFTTGNWSQPRSITVDPPT